MSSPIERVEKIGGEGRGGIAIAASAEIARLTLGMYTLYQGVCIHVAGMYQVYIQLAGTHGTRAFREDKGHSQRNT